MSRRVLFVITKGEHYGGRKKKRQQKQSFKGR